MFNALFVFKLIPVLTFSFTEENEDDSDLSPSANKVDAYLKQRFFVYSAFR